MFRDTGEHFGADFNMLMKRPNVVGKLGVTVPKLDVVNRSGKWDASRFAGVP
jgi:hypothetical protein